MALGAVTGNAAVTGSAGTGGVASRGRAIAADPRFRGAVPALDPRGAKREITPASTATTVTTWSTRRVRIREVKTRDGGRTTDQLVNDG